ncbi:MAG TPA: YbdK family carboxylate-amine ligase [Gaiella sp.]|jgi:carboxylate-amine ligase
MTLPFGSDFTVGVEEELLLVDPTTLALAPVTGEVLDAMRVEPRAAGHDAYAAQIELRSPPSGSVPDAVESLARLREGALAAGATPVGAGLHPDGRFGDATLVEGHRYELVADQLRGLLRRTPESALHVHVGLPDERAAVRAFNTMRLHVPLLLGLAANSPFWFGADSGLQTARFALSRAYPGRCIPRAVRDIEDLEQLAAETLAAAGLPDGTFLWWDLRLHPRHGTLELREMDAQSSLEHVAALAALARALVVEAAEGPDARHVPSEALDWAAFRAARDGTEATVVDDGRPRRLADVARDAVRRLRPIARDAGDADALEGVGAILAAGGAARQRMSHAKGGMPGLLRALVEETAVTGVPVGRGA